MNESKIKTTIAISKETSDKLKRMSIQKGVSQGVYIEKTINWLEENNVDYINGNSVVSAAVKKEIERVITLVRAYERDYFKPVFDNLGFIKSSLVGAIEVAKEQIGEHKSGVVEELETKLQDSMVDYNEFKKETGLVCQDINNSFRKLKINRRGDFELELSSEEKSKIENRISELMQKIY